MSGNTWTSVYDGFNRLISSISPANLTTNTWFDSRFQGGTQSVLTNTVTSIDASGVATQDAYNLRGDKTSTTLGHFDASTNMFSQWQDPTTYGYDIVGDVVSITTPAVGGGSPIVESKVYDSFGALIEDDQPASTSLGGTHAPYLAPTTYKYNGLGRLYEIDGPRQLLPTSDPNYANDTTTLSYDIQGNVTQSVEAGLSSDNTFSFVYDDAKNMVSATYPLSSNTTYATQATTTKNWTFDAGNTGLLNTYSWGSNTTTYHYDLAGRLVAADDPRNSVGTLHYVFDDLGNQIERYAQVGSGSKTDDETYVFDQDANLTHAVGPTGVTTDLTYADPDTRLTQVTQGSATTTYTYDGTTDTLGRVSKVVDTLGANPSMTTSFSYSPQGQLQAVSDPFTGSATNPWGGAPITSYTYDSAGRLTGRTDPAGLTWTRTYDSNSGDIVSQTIKKGSNTFASSAFTYDIAGNPITDAETVTGGGKNGTFVEPDRTSRLGSRTARPLPVQLALGSQEDHRNRLPCKRPRQESNLRHPV